MSEFQDDRTNPASPLRTEQARREGNVAKSNDLAIALQSVGSVIAGFILLSAVFKWVYHFTRERWQTPVTQMDADSNAVAVDMQNVITSALMVILPLLAGLFLIALASHLVQSGFVFKPARAIPDPRRLGIENWKKNTFSLGNLSQVLIGLPKGLIAFATAIWLCWIQRRRISELAGLEIGTLVEQMFGLVILVCFQTALVLFVFSLLDYACHWIAHQRQLQMSDQQLRDENRMQNGDPLVSSTRRRLHRDLIGRERTDMKSEA